MLDPLWSANLLRLFCVLDRTRRVRYSKFFCVTIVAEAQGNEQQSIQRQPLKARVKPNNTAAYQAPIDTRFCFPGKSLYITRSKRHRRGDKNIEAWMHTGKGCYSRKLFNEENAHMAPLVLCIHSRLHGPGALYCSRLFCILCPTQAERV